MQAVSCLACKDSEDISNGFMYSLRKHWRGKRGTEFAG
jgi:hypothetical protein